MKRPHRQHVEGGVAALYECINNLEILAAVLQATVKENHEWHERYDDHGGYPESALAEANTKALEHDLPLAGGGGQVKNVKEHGVDGLARFIAAIKDRAALKPAEGWWR